MLGKCPVFQKRMFGCSWKPRQIDDNLLETKILSIFEKVGCTIDPGFVDGCHRLGKNSDRVIIRFSRRKDCKPVPIQYNSAQAITGAIRGTSTEKLYNELGLETLEKRRWYRKLCCFYKVYKSHSLKYQNNIPQFKVKHNFFRNSFFPSAVIEWNKFDLNIRNSESLNVFNNSLLKFIRPSGKSVFNCHNPRGVKLLTRLRLGLSHLLEHKFKQGFQDSLNPICSCGNDIEILAHFLLHCPYYSHESSTFLNTIRNINRRIFNKNDLQINEILLYGDSSLDDKSNTLILNAAIDFLFVTKRFDVNLL